MKDINREGELIQISLSASDISESNHPQQLLVLCDFIHALTKGTKKEAIAVDLIKNLCEGCSDNFILNNKALAYLRNVS